MSEQTVRLAYIDSGQVLNIPQQFELSSDEVVLRKEGDRLIIEPTKRPSLLTFLATLTNLNEDFPDIDSDLLPLDDVEL